MNERKMVEDLYKSFSVKLQGKLKEAINGRIFVAPYPEYGVVLVKIVYDSFFFTHLIGNMDYKFKEPDMLNDCFNETLKYYKRCIFSTYIKDYEKKASDGSQVFRIPYEEA